MKTFYTFSDKREKYFDLYNISSIETYVNLISNIDLSTASLKVESSINEDYEFIQDIIRFISGGGNIILNNVSIIERHPLFFFYETINLIKIHLVNILSIIIPIRQYKFRGYVRTIYNLIANRASKKPSNYTFNEKRTTKYKFSTMKYAMILYTKKEI